MLLQLLNNKKLTIILSCIILFGFVSIKYWQHHRFVESQFVAKNYQIILSAMSAGDLVTVKNQSEKLIKFKNHAQYSKLAALFLAKTAVLDNNLVQAETILRRVVKENNQDPIWHIVNLRLIKILLLQNKLEEVEKIKNNIENKLPKTFLSKYQELFADLLVAKNQKVAANALYHDAVKNLPPEIPSILLDLKINETELES